MKKRFRNSETPCIGTSELLEAARRKLFDALTVPRGEMPRVTVKLRAMRAFAVTVGSLRANHLSRTGKRTRARSRATSTGITTFAAENFTFVRFYGVVRTNVSNRLERYLPSRCVTELSLRLRSGYVTFRNRSARLWFRFSTKKKETVLRKPVRKHYSPGMKFTPLSEALN